MFKSLLVAVLLFATPALAQNNNTTPTDLSAGGSLGAPGTSSLVTLVNTGAAAAAGQWHYTDVAQTWISLSANWTYPATIDPALITPAWVGFFNSNGTPSFTASHQSYGTTPCVTSASGPVGVSAELPAGTNALVIKVVGTIVDVPIPYLADETIRVHCEFYAGP